MEEQEWRSENGGNPMHKLHQSLDTVPYSIVLWGASFEESVAVIFVAALRQAGLPVQLIGLIGPRAAGMHGLALSPDITLSEALPLACQTICLLLPCDAIVARRIENDPRVLTFFQEAARNDALFIVSDRVAITLTSLHKLAIPPARIMTYTTHHNLSELAHTVARIVKDKINRA